MKSFKTLLLIVAVTLIGSMTAMAQPQHLQPGSALIYPLFDSTPGAGTLICVTNTNVDTMYCESDDNSAGDVALHYIYVADGTWREFDRFEMLTPGDTLCVIADQHNPEGERGFLIVVAVDPRDMDKRIDFDYLIGSSIVVQSGLNFLWSYTPYAFEGNPDFGSTPVACTRFDVDMDGDNDGALDFDFDEYDYFPETLYIDSFFEETGTFGNSLTLLTTTGGSYVAEVDFLFWNNIEQKFSRDFPFTCWWTGSLSEISSIVQELGGDPNELGVADVQTGWASIQGSRVVDLSGNPVPAVSGYAVPPLLGVFGQFITASDFAAGHALHYRGTLDGLELLVGNEDPQN